MSKRATYQANVVGFSLDMEAKLVSVNLANVVDSDGELIAHEMSLYHGDWSKNCEAGARITFSAKLTSQVQQKVIDGINYNVRECYLVKPKIKEN